MLLMSPRVICFEVQAFRVVLFTGFWGCSIRPGDVSLSLLEFLHEGANPGGYYSAQQRRKRVSGLEKDSSAHLCWARGWQLAAGVEP